ncbi:hypothetical protein PIB30_097894 [Stylosanthes scabra]|uniref:Putative plant transposon protein domain-containing protein n=1 Tax=Stylosanthes scabra TaxID=79078 RepID=A0ABU6YU54_9FABA|nr:hypothetical protein [Stylosanthes scabra]
MASSSAPASVFDDYHFRTEFNQTLFKSIVRKKKVTPEVGFNLDEDEYPQIKEQIALRGWRRLAAPITDISKLLVQEFYANPAVSDEEMEDAGQLPYKSYVRGVEVDFSPENIRRVMRFKEETPSVETDFRTRQATDQRLDEVLADLCVPDLPGIDGHLSSMQFLQQSFYENMQKSQAEYMEDVKAIKAKQEELWNNTNRFHSKIRKEQDMLARDIQEIRKGQINQTLMNTQRAEAEKNLEQAVEKQARDIAEMRKQLNLWTRNASAREAYSC